MALKFEARYKEAAVEAAKVTFVDDERRKSFEKGVDWCVGYFCRILAPSMHEHTKGYPKEMMDSWTLNDMRDALSKMTEKIEVLDGAG